MLQNIGDTLKTKKWLAYTVIALLAFVFTIWGAYSFVDVATGNGTYAASVNGDEISAAEANEVWQQQQAQLSQAFGGELTQEQRQQFQRQILDSQIRSLVATQQARKLGLRVSDAQLVRAIQAEQAFHVDGVFSPQVYRSRLAAVGLTEAAYEGDLQKTLLQSQLAGMIGGSDFLAPAEITRLLALQDEQRELRYALLEPGKFTAGPAPTTAEIEAYYQANAAEFTPPEAVKLAYAELTLADAAQSVVITDEALRDRYERERASYGEPERRRARHILITVDGATDDAKALAEAQALRARVVGGEDFAAVAKQASKDTASAAEGGDLGWAGRDAYVPAFADALFALAEGEVSAPVKSQFGYHVIKLEGIRAGATRTFEEVRPELSVQLRNELAAEAFGNRQEELQARAERGGAQLSQLVTEFGLRGGQIERFERGAGGLPLGSDAELNSEVFGDRVLGQRLVGGPIPLGEDRIVLVQVLEHEPPVVQPLADVRDDIVASLQRQRGAEAARKAAEDAVARLVKGEGFDAVLKALKATAEPARFIGRGDPELPVEVREAAFNLPHPQPGQPAYQAVPVDGGGAAVLALTAVRSEPAVDDPQIQALRAQRELQRYSMRDIDAYVAALMKSARIKVNPQAFTQ